MSNPSKVLNSADAGSLASQRMIGVTEDNSIVVTMGSMLILRSPVPSVSSAIWAAIRTA